MYELHFIKCFNFNVNENNQHFSHKRIYQDKTDKLTQAALAK